MASAITTCMDRFREEVLALHAFLNAWLRGEVPDGDAGPERLARALADDFVIVHPSGNRSTKTAVVRGFASAYGEKPSGYAIRIDQIETRMLTDGLCLATFEEWHEGEPGRARIATAVLRDRSGGAGIEWLFLQETLAPHLEKPGPGPATREA
jgi:hypothetical protein